jgi:hypothetical protein
MPAKKAASSKVEAYCVKCKKSQMMGDGKLQKTSNGRDMMCGMCPVCSTKMCKFLSADAAKKMKGGDNDDDKKNDAPVMEGGKKKNTKKDEKK